MNKIREGMEQERDALAARNTGLIQQCKAAEHQRDTHLNKLRTLNHGDASEAWHWMNDGNDQLESLTCPILISAEDLKGIFEERDALAAHVERLKEAGEAAALEAPSVTQAAIAWGEVCEQSPTTSLTRRDLIKQAEALEKIYSESQGCMIINRGSLLDESRVLRQRAQELTE